ncbi:MAG TPA: hypothetical protein VFX86_03840 [Candidatus Saccharimonadales bacterium]|nr:hypothetical protein [Candidatus Saccharimonadales bacterium]
MQHKHKAVRYFVFGQASLFLSISICIFLLPEGIFANDGISYYSAYKLTALPYAAGLLLTALFSYKVAGSLPEKAPRAMARAFKLISFMLVAIAVVPYGIDFVVEYTHTILSALLFLIQFLIVWWLAFRVRADIISLLLLVLMAAEMIFSVMYLTPRKGYLIFGELAFQITFAVAAYRFIIYTVEQSASRGRSS